MNDTASAAPVRDYPPLPDFETVEQHIYGACRRYITQDMLEPIHNLIRDAIDADRAMRAQAAPVPLTDAQLVASIEAAGFATWDVRMWKLKRLIEAAHGIKPAKEQANG